MEKLKDLLHLYVTVFLSGLATSMVVPSITDVTMSALCPGLDQCSLAIYLSGFQQAITGLGSVVMMPLIGNLSDVYGRKALLTFPMSISIIPLVIMAYSRSTSFFYAYYVLRTFTAMICDGGINCLALAYVADNVSQRERISAFGILTGIGLAAFVCASLAARFLSTALTFQVAALVSMLAVVYMRVFLKESVPDGEDLLQPILKGGPDGVEGDGESPKKVIGLKKIPSLRDMVCLLKISATFSQAAVVAFFHSLAEGGMQASALYFLKARFHFNKNQYADLLLMIGVAAATSQLILMPFLTPYATEEKLLSIGLLAGCANMFIYSMSWSAWVPYAITALALLSIFVTPSLRSIASKQVGATEQGKVQGCISGIASLASIIAPLIFSPLAALFLSENAPFSYPGFSIFCGGLAMMVAFLQSIMIRVVPPDSSEKISDHSFEA